MRLIYIVTALFLLLLISSCQSDAEPISVPVTTQTSSSGEAMNIPLPEPRYDSNISIEQSLLQRRSTRSFTGESLTLSEISQLLWAAQGITDARGYRTAPSAMALYPLKLYVVAGDVEELEAGVYEYDPVNHRLIWLFDGDGRAELSAAAMNQASVANGAVCIVFTAVYEKMTAQFGETGVRYAHLEAGHAAQNLSLQATAMGLGMVTVGWIDDEKVSEFLGLPEGQGPLYVIPVGRR